MTSSVNNNLLALSTPVTGGRTLAVKPAPSGRENDPAIGKVAREFESLFIGMMLKSMRSTVGKDSLTGGGHGEEVYRSLLDQEYANGIANGGGLGLRKMIEEQLKPHTGDNEDHDHRSKP